jgi:hypothetical protein
MFQNSFFLTFKPKGNKPSTELKESIDLKDVENIYVKDDTIHLELKNGEILLYKGSQTNDWINSMKSRSAKAQEVYKKSLAEDASTGVHIAGWLKKKSHNKYQGFQVCDFFFLLVFISYMVFTLLGPLCESIWSQLKIL